MKKIPVEYLIPGMILAEDVITPNNQFLAGRETVLTENLIARFDFYNIKTVNISTEQIKSQEAVPAPADASPAPADAPAESYSAKVKKTANFQHFASKLETKSADFSHLLEAIEDPDLILDVDVLFNGILDILPKDTTTISIFDMVHNARENTDSVNTHSINVAIICNVIARWLKYSDEDIKLVTVAGLLHDIGKSQIPDEIINKKGRLTPTEFSIIKSHPVYSYNFLVDRGLDKRIVEAALQHHERCDGSGYPNNLKGPQIGEFSKIVAIADVYDAMTCSRDYRRSACPFKVVSLFEQEGLEKYDPHIILTFLERIVLTYMHNNVRLSDDRIGEIVMINRLTLSKPIVKIGDEFVDLSKQTSLTIEAIV